MARNDFKMIKKKEKKTITRDKLCISRLERGHECD